MSDGYGRSAASPITRDQAVRLIVQTCLTEGVTDERQIAYVLATAEHESQNFTSLEEAHGRKQAARRGYEGNEQDGYGSGEEYFGRGYAHLTHWGNYQSLGEALGRGNELAEDPALAADPEVASRVLVIGMRDGLFTRRGLDDYVNEDSTDYWNARRIVNGTDRAADVAELARAWEPRVADLVTSVQRDGVDLTPTQAAGEVDAPLQRGDANARAFELQQYLSALNVTNAAGQPLSADGDFGPSTEQAVRNYQEMAGINPRTGTVDQALFDRIRGEVLQADPDFRLKTIMDLYGPLNDRVLDPDDRGDAVAELQEQLQGLGMRGRNGRLLDVSRIYDPDTQAAVRRFQRDEAIVPANGLADEATRDAINARAVERGLQEATEVVRRREAAQEAPAQERNDPEAGRQGLLQPGQLQPGLLQPGLLQPGPFNDPVADRYFAAVMAGDSDLADRLAIEFAQSPEGQQFAREGDELLAQQQAQEQQQQDDRQRAQQGPVMQM